MAGGGGGGRDGWLSTFSHKTLTGAGKSASAVSSTATMSTTSQGGRGQPTHAIKSPSHSQPLQHGRPQQLPSSGVDNSVLASQSASVLPTLFSPLINGSTAAVVIEVPPALEQGDATPRPRASPRLSVETPRRSIPAAQSPQPSPAASAIGLPDVEMEDASASAVNVEPFDVSQPARPGSSPVEAAGPQATPSGASHPPTQSTSEPAAAATQESGTPTRALSPARSIDPSQTSVHTALSPSPMRSARKTEQASAPVVDVPAEMQRQSLSAEDGVLRPSGAPPPLVASVLVRTTPSPER